MKNFKLNKDTSEFMLTNYTTITQLKLAYEKVTHRLGYISVIRYSILNFNEFGYLNERAKPLLKMLFSVFKLHTFKTFAKINSTDFLTGKIFDYFVIFYKFQKLAIAKYFNILYLQNLIQYI